MGHNNEFMFFARRPSRPAIERFLAESQELPLSYRPIGIAQTAPAGYDIDETVVAIGRSQTGFDRAKVALIRWTHFDIGWVELFPPTASVEPGTVVGVLIHHLGFWSLNGCRVVYGVGDRESTRFGFAYGTLINHAEVGEEIFEVFLQPGSDNVVYRIRAVSRPRAALARLGYPFTRALQARFRRASADAMKQAAAGPGLRP
jgi:uncharacterized protein (UPF0548 family)